MEFRLNKNCSVESWPNKSWMIVDKRNNHAHKLSQKTIDILLAGTDNQSEEAPELAQLIELGLIVTDAEQGKPIEFEINEHHYRNTAVIGLTGRCNYNCRHCIAADGVQAKMDELSLETLTDFFKQCIKLGIANVWFTGGEPMFHPQWKEIVEAAAASGLQITRILTNGFFLNDETLEHLKNLHQYPTLGISFDGIGTHDWMRNHKGAEETSLAAIKLAIQHGFNVMPHINVNHVTAPVIMDTCRLLVKEYGCQSLRLIPTSQSPRWLELADGDNISYDDYYALMLDVIRTAHDEEWNVSLDLRSLPQMHNKGCEHAMKYLKNPPKVNPRRSALSACPRTKNQIFLAPDGRILPCNAYEGTSKQYGFLIGDDVNIHKRPLKDILTDSQYIWMCTQTAQDIMNDVARCAQCKWMSVCNGGCPLWNLGNRQGLSMENPNCDFFTRWADKYIALLEELGITSA